MQMRHFGRRFGEEGVWRKGKECPGGSLSSLRRGGEKKRKEKEEVGRKYFRRSG